MTTPTPNGGPGKGALPAIDPVTGQWTLGNGSIMRMPTFENMPAGSFGYANLADQMKDAYIQQGQGAGAFNNNAAGRYAFGGPQFGGMNPNAAKGQGLLPMGGPGQGGGGYNPFAGRGNGGLFPPPGGGGPGAPAIPGLPGTLPGNPVYGSPGAPGGPRGPNLPPAAPPAVGSPPTRPTRPVTGAPPVNTKTGAINASNATSVFESLTEPQKQAWVANKVGAYYAGGGTNQWNPVTGSFGPAGGTPPVRTTPGAPTASTAPFNPKENWDSPVGTLTAQQFEALAESLTSKGAYSGPSFEELTKDMSNTQRAQFANYFGPGQEGWKETLKWYSGGK